MSPTRSRILEHGTNMLSASGLSGVTLGVLAQRSGMSKSGLFAHFRSKQDLDLALLEHTSGVASRHVLEPALKVSEGLPRLKKLVQNWLGWTAKAGLAGGCPVAAGLFEMDDCQGPVRDRLLAMESHWRGVLTAHAQRAVELGHLRSDIDVAQMIWELCGIYLGHHASLRFVRDPRANHYAQAALDALWARWKPQNKHHERPKLSPRRASVRLKRK